MILLVGAMIALGLTGADAKPMKDIEYRAATTDVFASMGSTDMVETTTYIVGTTDFQTTWVVETTTDVQTSNIVETTSANIAACNCSCVCTPLGCTYSCRTEGDHCDSSLDQNVENSQCLKESNSTRYCYCDLDGYNCGCGYNQTDRKSTLGLDGCDCDCSCNCTGEDCKYTCKSEFCLCSTAMDHRETSAQCFAHPRPEYCFCDLSGENCVCGFGEVATNLTQQFTSRASTFNQFDNLH